MSKTRVFSLMLLTSLLLLAALTVNAVNAQSQATVIILQAIGGTTNPGAGTQTYNDGTSVTITATGDTSTASQFTNWIISTSAGSRISTDNPITFPVSAGQTYTIQPVFQVIQPIGVVNLQQNLSSAAIVVVLSAAGGTTVPAPGAYAFTNATAFNITAMANNGWTFSHWVISGSDVTTGHGSIPTNLEPTDNPYNVNHGYGNTYYYQPVFTQSGSASPSPSSSASPSPTIPELSFIVLVAVLVAMIPLVFVARKMRKA